MPKILLVKLKGKAVAILLLFLENLEEKALIVQALESNDFRLRKHFAILGATLSRQLTVH